SPGTPRAVVLDPDGRDPAAMQAIARESNHPEPVFVSPPAERAHRARIRIFTPARELAFAGHPTVGAAVLLGLRDGAPAGREIVLEEGIGPVRCVLEAGAGGAGPAPLPPSALPAAGRAQPAHPTITAPPLPSPPP